MALLGGMSVVVVAVGYPERVDLQPHLAADRLEVTPLKSQMLCTIRGGCNLLGIFDSFAYFHTI
jgi:hypothetical protein